jgi:hypothetical protein
MITHENSKQRFTDRKHSRDLLRLVITVPILAVAALWAWNSIAPAMFGLP